MRTSLFLFIFAFLWSLGWFGCSTSKKSDLNLPVAPPYTQVSHPHGTDLSDLRTLFYEPSAPQMPDFAFNCDKEFLKLVSVTQSTDELQMGIQELVRSNPVHFHWCFYGKLLQLQDGLKKESFVDEKQKQVLDTFQFLSAVAKTFNSEFHDSRYLRYAVTHYKKISEWVFFRRLDLTPTGTSELVQPSNPFGLWRKMDGGFSVLQKYHIEVTANASPTPSLLPSAEPSDLKSNTSIIAPTNPSSVETVPPSSSTPAPIPVANTLVSKPSDNPLASQPTEPIPAIRNPATNTSSPPLPLPPTDDSVPITSTPAPDLPDPAGLSTSATSPSNAVTAPPATAPAVNQTQ